MVFDLASELNRLRFDLDMFLKNASRREILFNESIRVLTADANEFLDAYDVARAFSDLSFFKSSETADRALRLDFPSDNDLAVPALLDACAVMIGFRSTPPAPKRWRPNLLADRLAAVILRCQALHLFEIAEILVTHVETLRERGALGYSDSQLLLLARRIGSHDGTSDDIAFNDEWSHVLESLDAASDIRPALRWLAEQHVSRIGTFRNRDDHEFGSQVFRLFPVACLAFVSKRKTAGLVVPADWRLTHPILQSPLAIERDCGSVTLPKEYGDVLKRVLNDPTDVDFLKAVGV